MASHATKISNPNTPRLSRRRVLGGLSSAASLAVLGSAGYADSPAELPPIRQLTQGPLNHWFGYYDKREFDPSNRLILSNEVNFAGRTPKPDDEIGVGIVDTQDNDKWIPLGNSHA